MKNELREYRKNMLEFIDYLHDNRFVFKSEIPSYVEIDGLIAKRDKLEPRKKYIDKIEFEKLQSKIIDLFNELSVGNLICSKAIELNLFEDVHYTYVIKNHLNATAHLDDNISTKEAKKIVEAKDKYLEFRKVTNFYSFYCDMLFRDLDVGLINFFSAFTDTSDMERAILKPIEVSPKVEYNAIKNTFNDLNIEIVKDNFRGLEMYMKNGEFDKWIYQAFEKNELPKQKYELYGSYKKRDIIRFFYKFYTKSHAYGEKGKYVKLLTDYFKGYTYETVFANFRK